MTKISNFRDFNIKNEGLFDFLKKKKDNFFTKEELEIFKQYIYDPYYLKVDKDKFITGTVVSTIRTLPNLNIFQTWNRNLNREEDHPITTIEIFTNNKIHRNNNYTNGITGYYTIIKKEGEYHVNSNSQSIGTNSPYFFKESSINNTCEKINKSIFIYKLSQIMQVKYEKMDKLIKDYSLLSKDYVINKFRLIEVIKELDEEDPIHFDIINIEGILKSITNKLKSTGININNSN